MEAQGVFTNATPTRLATPLRVSQGVLNASGYFQVVLTQRLEGLDCEVWVDNFVFCGREQTELFDTLYAILRRLEDTRLFLA